MKQLEHKLMPVKSLILGIFDRLLSFPSPGHC
jgi:hypothetical protein